MSPPPLTSKTQLTKIPDNTQGKKTWWLSNWYCANHAKIERSWSGS
ncbi:hypothetical protein [Streptomyces azureus]|nr:hypothetical protein [Streptomyces azureus]